MKILRRDKSEQQAAANQPAGEHGSSMGSEGIGRVEAAGGEQHQGQVTWEGAGLNPAPEIKLISRQTLREQRQVRSRLG